MWERIREIIVKELRQAFREPRMRVLLFVPPILQLIIFGFAVNLDVQNASIAWMDRDASRQSRDLYYRFAASPYFEVTHVATSDREAQSLLDHGDVQGVVSVQAGFGRDVLRGRQTEVQVLLDGSNSNTAGIIANYASQVIGTYSADAFIRVLNGRLVGNTARGAVNRQAPSIRASSRVWFNPDLRSRNYFVPAVIVNIILVVTSMLTALAIVREKEIGTMEQLMVTPIRPMELMVGKMLPFALVGMLDTALVTVLALVVFRVPFRGNLLVLALSAGLFLLTTLGTGLFLSTISRTQQQAMMGSFFFVLPASMLSGFAFPVRNMPLPIRTLTYLDPMRYFVEIVRDVFLKGSGISLLWPQMLAMLVFGVAIFWFSALRFHKRLD